MLVFMHNCIVCSAQLYQYVEQNIMSRDLAAQCMVGDVTVDWELPSGGLYIMPSRHGVAAAFAEPGENNYRLVPPMLHERADLWLS